MRSVFRDPIHGLISLEGEDAGALAVLDTPAFQRLRRIRQMGFASLVYSGAEHTRFGHALGAFHVARRVTQEMGVEPRVARDVKFAALAHDVGHGPFSHAWEEALGGAGHEKWGRRIVAEDETLRDALAKVAPELPDAICGFFDKTYVPRFARKLVSSQLDVDRMDYLLRDAHFSGVGYSAYDLDWIVHAMKVARVHAGDDPDDLVIEYRRGMHAVEQYLAGRSYMYAQVYYHKTVRAAEWMFLLAMRRFATLAREGTAPGGLAVAGRLARSEEVSVAEYLTLDDATVTCALASWASGGTTDPVLADLSGRLGARRLFKTIDLGEEPERAERLAPRFAELARERFGEAAAHYWVIDRARRLGYDARPGEEIFVVGHPRLGTVDLGRLVAEAPIGRPAEIVRVICAPELVPAFADAARGS